MIRIPKAAIVIVSLIAAASLLLSACSPVPEANDKLVSGIVSDVLNGPGAPRLAEAAILGAPCIDPITEIYWIDPDSASWGSEVVTCHGMTQQDLIDSTKVTWVDAAALAVPIATPLPIDDVAAVLVESGKVIRVAIVVGSAWLAGEGIKDYIIQMSRHTSLDHDPNYTGTKARTYITTILAIWAKYAAGGPPPNDKFRCAVTKVGEVIVRISVILKYQSDSNAGIAAWYDVTSGRWGGSYLSKMDKFIKGPRFTDKSWTYNSNDDTCANLPPGGLPPLQMADH